MRTVLTVWCQHKELIFSFRLWKQCNVHSHNEPTHADPQSPLVRAAGVKAFQQPYSIDLHLNNLHVYLFIYLLTTRSKCPSCILLCRFKVKCYNFSNNTCMIWDYCAMTFVCGTLRRIDFVCKWKDGDEQEFDRTRENPALFGALTLRHTLKQKHWKFEQITKIELCTTKVAVWYFFIAFTQSQYKCYHFYDFFDRTLNGLLMMSQSLPFKNVKQSSNLLQKILFLPPMLFGIYRIFHRICHFGV